VGRAPAARSSRAWLAEQGADGFLDVAGSFFGLGDVDGGLEC
jgi:hypothetical protein